MSTVTVLCTLDCQRLGRHTGEVHKLDPLERLLKTSLDPSGVTKHKAQSSSSPPRSPHRGHMSLALPSGAPQSGALPSRLLPLGPRLRPIDPAAVTLQLVCGLLVAGDVHQLQVLNSEEQAVEVLPVHFPPIPDRFRQRGDHGALLLYSAKSGRDSHAAVSATHTTGCRALSHEPQTFLVCGHSVYRGRQPYSPS